MPKSFLFPPVLLCEKNGDRLQLELELSPDLTCFSGHFPDYPILPGVVQIHWAIQFAQKFLEPTLGTEFSFMRLERIKFNEVIQPGGTVRLALYWDESSQRVEFEYQVKNGRGSSGRICFARMK